MPRKRQHSDITPAESVQDGSLDSDVQLPKKRKVRWDNHTSPTQESDTESTQEESSEAEKICVSVLCQRGRVAAAYYDPVKHSIFLLEDTKETQHLDVTSRLLEQISPDVILTSSGADELSIDTLKEYADQHNGLFQIRPQKEFTPTKGKDRLSSLSIVADLQDDDDLPDEVYEIQSRTGAAAVRNAYEFMQKRKAAKGDPTLRRWNASLRLSNFASIESSPLCIASVGALLDLLVRQRADADDDGIIGLDVRTIETLLLENVMHINADALFSLQIFENESHASVHSDKTKEGLSLFGTLNNTVTGSGRALLYSWFLQPSLSIPVINARHDAVECFANPENHVTAGEIHDHLKGIKHMPRILDAVKSGRAKLSDWQGLMKFTFHSAMVRDALCELHDAADVRIIKDLVNAFKINFKEIGSRINETIDWEESGQAGRVCIRPHIDEELDNRKHVYNGIDTVLSNVAGQICTMVPEDYATSLNVVYFPQLGFLVCIPMLEEWKTEAGIKVIDGWSFQFSSDSCAYFKSQQMHDMDEHIGDLHSLIVDREIEIVQDLVNDILSFEEAMRRACDVCAELDCLLSFAEASIAHGYKRPEMVEANTIQITQGRHPLHEQVVDTFVPNDAFLIGGAGITSTPSGNDEKNNSVIVCTGANACGKVLTRLLQFISSPGTSSENGVFAECIFETDCPYPIHGTNWLVRDGRAICNPWDYGQNFYAYIDEGVGIKNGAGLFCGVLKHCLSRGADCPKVLAATHFHDVFCSELLDPKSVHVSFRHMQVLFTAEDGRIVGGQRNTSQDDNEELSQEPTVGLKDKITYLYRIGEGLSLESHAAKCAAIFGLPSRLVERAQYVSSLLSTHELGKLLDEGITEKEREDLEDAEAVCRRFLAWRLDDRNQSRRSVKKVLAEILGRTGDD